MATGDNYMVGEGHLAIDMRMGPTLTVRKPDEPRGMPELRESLLDLVDDSWRDYESMKGFLQLLGVLPEKVRDAGDHIIVEADIDAAELSAIHDQVNLIADASVRWYRESISTARLIYVASELVDVIEASAETIPDDVVMHPSLLPAPAGLMLFQRPWNGTDASTGERMKIDAVAWGRSNVEGVLCMTFGLFRHLPHYTPGMEGINGLDYTMGPESWMPLGRTDWPIGDRLDALLPETAFSEAPYLNDVQWGSMLEDRRFAVAAWALIQQKRVVESYEVTADRAQRRRIERKGREAAPVTVVHLRAGRDEYRPQAVHSGVRTYQRRWVVSPHWRNQAYGPKQQLRKLILIAPHVKGPAGAPLVHAERVWALDR